MSRRGLLLVVLLLSGGCREASTPDGTVVKFVTTDQGDGQGRLYAPVGVKGAAPAVIVLHGDHGLTPAIEDHCRRIARAGFRVLAVDLYRGEKIDSLLDAHIMDRGMPEDRVKGDLRGAVDYLAGRKDVRKEAIGIIGWDMGGGYALDAAMADPRLRAVVTCYGRLTTDPQELGKMQAAVLAIMAEKDEGNPAETRRAFQNAMKEAGRTLEGMEVLGGVDHGFMNPAGREPTREEAVAAETAWERIVAFLRDRLATP